jgi:RNA polymerase sigma-54 factor
MEMFFSQQTAPRPLQQTPLWLVYSNEFLGLSALDLQTRLHEEAQVNPALEVEERPICATCGRALRGPLCRYCLPSSVAVAPNSGSSFEPDESAGFVRGSARDEADLDPLAHYAAPMELREALALALQAELPSEAAPIIEYLVGNLDEEGYLRCTVEETAQVVNVPVSQVEQVLAHLHAQEPSGIGARDVRECLLLQLRHLAAQGCEQPDALAIVTHFLH